MPPLGGIKTLQTSNFKIASWAGLLRNGEKIASGKALALRAATYACGLGSSYMVITND